MNTLVVIGMIIQVFGTVMPHNPTFQMLDYFVATLNILALFHLNCSSAPVQNVRLHRKYMVELFLFKKDEHAVT